MSQFNPHFNTVLKGKIVCLVFFIAGIQVADGKSSPNEKINWAYNQIQSHEKPIRVIYKTQSKEKLKHMFSRSAARETTIDSSLVTNTPINIFMSGDVMTGRGIDQVLPHPGNPIICESYMKDARGYVELAERKNGKIKQPVSFSYIWGDALKELERADPDLRMINLETSITRSGDYWKGKGINYRMHPDNTPFLTAAKIDYSSLANNHVLDWGYSGLMETMAALKKENVRFSGAGLNIEEAEAPGIMEIDGKGRGRGYCHFFHSLGSELGL